MKTYTVYEDDFCGSFEISADSLDSAVELARGRCLDNLRRMPRRELWADGLSTVWSHCTVVGPDGDRGSATVTLHPPEPECKNGRGHDWQEGAPRCNGGGVITRDTCLRCGCVREYDSWAMDPYDGTQGHTAWTYTGYAE